MGRTPGWMALVATTLEVCTLAFIDYVTDSKPARGPVSQAAPSPAAEAPTTHSPEASPAPPASAEEPAPPAPFLQARPDPAASQPPPPRPVIGEPPSFRRLEADSAPASAPVTNDRVPGFLLDVADRTAQIMRADSRRGPVYAGFYPDGSVRFVGCDGVGYEGRSENAVAELTEYGGSKSIRMQVGVSPESKLQITVHGGLHDGETLQLEMITERLPQ